ncbi:Flagellar hook-associated protein FlgK [Methylophaga frappieri]|uniref:Flagellar hook-associated protein 1 n=1 Tax=Methylophaga frappieri (strain ATCC BAA-2434 / DSM 25690 / JAM7) TaxID=754477 RepID=I1YKM6_METFJ|nr:flagellar hook-associated protein FlgK [Methylophaga frappieri]AFJ03469.1 Flagellar hook-associated protein FlgK [Methylophaga frappieri]
MSLLNIGTSGLLASQGALKTTSHNISNINTEGYNRQRVNQVTLPANFTGSYYFGNGTAINNIERLFDQFLTQQIRSTTSQEQSLAVFTEFSGQIDDILGSEELSLNAGFDSFFNAMQAVADDPTSIAAREVLLTEAEILASRFNTLDSQLSGFNQQINQNLEANVREINRLTANIAELNRAIVDASNSGSSTGLPNDLLDQRDKLLTDLSKLVSVNTVEQDNGSLSVFIGNGQSVVQGYSNITLSTLPDPTDSTRLIVAYGPNNIDVSAQISGGRLGGLLTVRGNVIDKVRSEIDALAVGFTQTMNAQHTAGLTLSGAAGGNLFEPSDPLGTPPANAANIRVAISNPRDLAVAFPVAVQTTATNAGTGAVSIAVVDGSDPAFNAASALTGNALLTFDATTNEYTVDYNGETVTFTYNPVTDSGREFDLNALGLTSELPLTIVLQGVPETGDSFSIGNNFTGGNFTATGDNRNALAMARLQVQKTLDPGATGSPTDSFNDIYGNLLADIATRTQQAESNQQTQKGLLEQTIARAQSVSGVNLDEEAANLIKFQQSYQAAAQVISVSNTIFDTLINSI